jgi:hypothetical protein
VRRVVLMVAVVVSGFFGYSYAQGPIATPARCTADVNWFEGQSSRRGEFTNDVSFCLKGVLLTADAMEFTEAEDGSRIFKLDGNFTLTMPPASNP